MKGSVIGPDQGPRKKNQIGDKIRFLFLFKFKEFVLCTTSLNLLNSLLKSVLSFPHFTKEETEAERGVQCLALVIRLMHGGGGI